LAAVAEGCRDLRHVPLLTKSRMPPAARANSPGPFEGSEASGRGLGILSHRPLWALSLLCVQEGEVLFQDVTALPDQLVSLVREHVHDMIDHLEILPLPP
jgi:hypothetical protein